MKTWRVLLRGENFPLDTQQGAPLMGFYATRWVAAPDEQGAFAAAVEQLREAPELSGIPKGCGANIVSEDIAELPHGQVPPERRGLTTFRMATSSA